MFAGRNFGGKKFWREEILAGEIFAVDGSKNCEFCGVIFVDGS